jgi:hypothetical protein
MRYDYRGFWNCDSCCDIEAHRRSDGKYVFVGTELPDNPGTSVSNYAEHLATAMLGQYGLKPDQVIWIEHYPEARGRRKEDFDLVQFLAVEGEPFRMPAWTRITEQAVRELIVGVRTVDDLIPRRANERTVRQTGLRR